MKNSYRFKKYKRRDLNNCTNTNNDDRWFYQVYVQWDDDKVCFVLEQHAKLDFYGTSSLKQQSADRHVATLRHIILIPSQLIFAQSWETTNTNSQSLVWTDPCSNSRSTGLAASTLTIISPHLIEERVIYFLKFVWEGKKIRLIFIVCISPFDNFKFLFRLRSFFVMINK